MVGHDAVQASDYEDLPPVPWQGLASLWHCLLEGCTCNQVWQTDRAKTSTCTISILVWCHSPSHQLHLLHSLTQAACHSTSADHEVIASVTGPLVNAGTATAVINVKGTTPASTAPFVPPNHMSSTPKQLPHLGTNASSIEVVYRSPKATGHSITGAFQQDLVF